MFHSVWYDRFSEEINVSLGFSRASLNTVNHDALSSEVSASKGKVLVGVFKTKAFSPAPNSWGAVSSIEYPSEGLPRTISPRGKGSYKKKANGHLAVKPCIEAGLELMHVTLQLEVPYKWMAKCKNRTFSILTFLRVSLLVCMAFPVTTLHDMAALHQSLTLHHNTKGYQWQIWNR